ncbi:MAG: flagellar type III secretion system pore protein FliP [Oscillospiraceae bacterium]
MKNMIKSNAIILKNAVCFIAALIIMCFALNCPHTYAAGLADNEEYPDLYGDNGSSITIDLGSGEAEDSSSALDLLFLLALIALIPTVLIMATSFTRIIISFSFLRNALGTQTSPPNQVLTGLALFLTLFIMMPVINEINENAYKPYVAGSITQEEALNEGVKPLKVFMLKQVYKDDLNMFMEIADSKGAINIEEYNSQDKLSDLSLLVIMPSFILSEVKRGFLIGFLLYIPFLIIDLVVSSTLMSMGMMMLPPSMISLPFKLMLFILADGWNLLIQSLIAGFN